MSADLAALMAQVEGIEAFLTEAGCSPAAAQQMAIVAEEILTNIQRDAWPAAAPGACVVDVEAEADATAVRVMMRTDDDGIAFDPTLADDPDTDAALDDRQVGGLGILLVRTMTDTQTYARVDGHNVLTVTKVCPLG